MCKLTPLAIIMRVASDGLGKTVFCLQLVAVLIDLLFADGT